MTNSSKSPATGPKSQWSLPDDVTYLNHGSFGPSPQSVQQVRNQWSARLESQPMDFFVRQMEEHLRAARQRLGEFIGAAGDDLIFIDNATYGMNIVAAHVDLQPNDEVLVTDHEYGAVLRIWRHACRQAGAKLVVQQLPRIIVSPEEIVDEFLTGATGKTRLIVVSHVTSPTAIILPLRQICCRAREFGIPVCIDGPHAVAMIPLNLGELDCDYYTASCHKWLCAPFGTGFLYVARKHQHSLDPPIMSWGGSVSGHAANWKDEFNWAGTRDPAGFLTVPAAIDFLETAGIDDFRRSTHELARYARSQITGLTGMEPCLPDSNAWYGSMIALPIPASGDDPPKDGQRDPLQDALWQQHRIEIPIIHWHGRRFVRVSCHLYNSRSDIDHLVDALTTLLRAVT
jgi:isopenicillin-N epimerase